MTSLDPAQASDYQTWIVVEQMYNGLYNFSRDGSIYPDIAAELPEISDDGRTYTIPLKSGIRFHNGKEVTATDVKYSLERSLWPEVQGWGRRFLQAVEGAPEVTDGGARELSGVQVLDPHTLQIRLRMPQGVFVHNLGVSTTFVVDREEVERRGADFPRYAVGTGPYMLREWVPGQRFVMERNPNYFDQERAGKIDTIEYQLGVDGPVGLLRLQRNEVDFLADGIPPADFQRIINDAQFRDMIGSGPMWIVNWLSLNTQKEPFDNLQVRQAVSAAIDRERVIRALGGLGQRTNDYIPEGIPGHNPNRRQPDFDQARARALLQEAGLGGGFQTEFHVDGDTATHVNVSQVIQQDLREVGIDATLRTLNRAAVRAAIGTPGTVSMALGGKGANYPDPWDFLSQPMCVNARAGTIYADYYCNQEYDALVDRAETLGADPAARLQLFEQAADILSRDIPRVFLWDTLFYTLHTPRLQGFYIHPIFRYWWRDYALA